MIIRTFINRKTDTSVNGKVMEVRYPDSEEWRVKELHYRRDDGPWCLAGQASNGREARQLAITWINSLFAQGYVEQGPSATNIVEQQEQQQSSNESQEFTRQFWRERIRGKSPTVAWNEMVAANLPDKLRVELFHWLTSDSAKGDQTQPVPSSPKPVSVVRIEKPATTTSDVERMISDLPD